MKHPFTHGGGPMIGHLIHVSGKPLVSVFIFFFVPFFFFPLTRFFRRETASGLGAVSATRGADQKGACARFFPMCAGVLDGSGSG